ncbi:MAG: T9SS type B sorting domain-containing protein [Bacteroidota bacterium]
MRNKILLFCLFSLSTIYGQNKEIAPIDTSNSQQAKQTKNRFSFATNRKIEDKHGNLITDSLQREAYFIKKQAHLDQIYKNSNRAVNQIAVPLCYNGNFEEFETVSGNNVLTYFQYTLGNADNPIQCKTDILSNFIGVNQYNPNNMNIMATTIPSNYLDEYIGDIHAFDQYCLKINYKESDEAMTMVQAKRFKTDNENFVKFNYKAVLQTIFESGHDDEQPYFIARVVNNAGQTVSQFCLIGDPNNCIFSQADAFDDDSITLYTPNWQSGMLDISSIPNNEEFTVEFFASRCGLGGHFGYAYVDDICLLHSNENLQGSITLDPLYKICPSLPMSVCGDFTIPNSGGIFATVASITLSIRDANGIQVYTSSAPTSIDFVTKRFCFDITQANLPNTTTGSYNVSTTINYNVTQTDCNGTVFNSATDDDANPGWDIWFLNCTNCTIDLNTTSLTLCDANHNGKEFFNLTNANASIVTSTAGLTFSYFETLTDATNDTNPIVPFTNYESPSRPIFVRVIQSPTCYRIIAISLVVKNPAATISGILNICSGSTVLTASPGASYLWANGQITQSITVTAIGTYSVTVTDAFGCTAVASVTILPNQVAVSPTIVVTQPNCFVATGTIQITSPASEYSYDNGTTWSTNSTMSNLNIGGYWVKIRTASGCTSYGSFVTITPTLATFPDYIKTDPTFCGDFGSITITTVSDLYSFDDGVTWTTSNTLTNLLSGVYRIRVKDSFGCISNYNSIELEGQFLSNATFIANNPYCGNLGDITITTPADLYSFDGGATWQMSNTLTNLPTGTYFIKVKNAQGCTSPNVYVFLTDFENTNPQYTIVDAGCGTYAYITINTLADFYSFDGGTTWGTNPLAINLVGGQTYDLQIKKANCLSTIAHVPITTYYLPIPNTHDYETTYCDDLNDGSESMNLTQYNGNVISNASSFSFSYYTTYNGAENANTAFQIANFSAYTMSNINNTVYIRVTSSDNCHKVAKLKFVFIDSPVIVMNDSYPLCEFRITHLGAGYGFDSYLWSTGQTSEMIFITQPGNYWVTVTETHGSLICNSTKNFNVFLSNPAIITSIETYDWTHYQNEITVFVSGIGDYEYSIDGIHYQTSNQFTDLESGAYTVYVRDKNNCGISKENVFLLMYPNFFTPNGDGNNDFWSIKLSQFEANFKVEIYDRSSKLMKTLTKNGNGWDGTYNGAMVPADDYWFVVTREDGRQHRGHFSLKR